MYVMGQNVFHKSGTGTSVGSADSQAAAVTIFIFLKYMNVLSVYHTHAGAWGHQKKESDHLELQGVVSRDAGAANPTQVLYESTQCLQPLSHLSRPHSSGC